MKKALIGLFFLGLANLAYPQNSNGGQEEVKLKGVTVSPINIDYLLDVHDNTLAERVLELQYMVARFDLAASSLYNGKGTYEISFKQPQGKILATFNGDGKILQSYEWFKNIAFPKAVRNQIYKKYPGWTVQGNTYQVSYFHDGNAKKVYKVLLTNGDLKKRIKIDATGNLLALAH